MQYKLSASDHSSSDGSSNAGSGIAVHFATTRQPDLFQAAKHCTFFLFLGVEVVCRGNKRRRSREGESTFSCFHFFGL